MLVPACYCLTICAWLLPPCRLQAALAGAEAARRELEGMTRAMEAAAAGPEVAQAQHAQQALAAKVAELQARCVWSGWGLYWWQLLSLQCRISVMLQLCIGLFCVR